MVITQQKLPICCPSCNLSKAYLALWLLILHVGDDCVSIGAGCYNVEIRNITCGPSHGIRYIHCFKAHMDGF